MWKTLVIVPFLSLLFHQHKVEKVGSIKPKVHPPHRNPDERIIGGDEAIPHAYPYQVGLSINDGISFCGGTLISTNYVITAAHCAIVIYNVEIILGAHNISSKESTQVRLAASDVKLHESYNSMLHRNDIAVLKLNQSVKTSYAIQIAKLPSFSDAGKIYENHFALATGWGLITDVENPTVDDMSDTLQVVSMPVMNTDVCTEYYNDEDSIYVTKSHLCTSGYRNKGTCSGDSGGPLVYAETLIGISSFGSTKCEECYPSVFTRVGAYLDWIEKNTDVHIDL